MTCVANALDESGMEQLAETVLGKFGRADILLHIAGGYRGGTLKDTTSEVWDQMLDTNLRTAVHSMRAFLPMLSTNGWGRIVTISSGITQTPPGNAVAYVTAKAALETMTIAVAQEVKDKGVTANVVLIPAVLDTPAERAKQPDKVTGVVRPEDVAAKRCSFYVRTRAGESPAHESLCLGEIEKKSLTPSPSGREGSLFHVAMPALAASPRTQKIVFPIGKTYCFIPISHPNPRDN